MIINLQIINIIYICYHTFIKFVLEIDIVTQSMSVAIMNI